MRRRKSGSLGGNRSFAVIGLGNFGSAVAQSLTEFGNHVIGIDVEESRVAQFSDVLTQALIVDARDDAALIEAGVADCDVALIAVGEDLEASILAAINVKTIGVPLVWAKAKTKTHHRILSKLKVDRIIHPEAEVGQHIALVLHNPTVRDYVSLGNGFHIVNFRVPETLEDKPLSDVNYAEFDLRCVAAMRGTEFLGRDGASCTLCKGDLLVLLGRRPDLLSFADSIA